MALIKAMKEREVKWVLGWYGEEFVELWEDENGGYKDSIVVVRLNYDEKHKVCGGNERVDSDDIGAADCGNINGTMEKMRLAKNKEKGQKF